MRGLGTEGSFIATVDKRFWRHAITGSLLPLQSPAPVRREFLRGLFTRVSRMEYVPSLPRGYIVSSKANGVARFVPALKLEDLCVFYFCVKQLDDEVAENRVPGTFGGWRLGGKIRKSEAAETNAADGENDASGDPGYGPAASFNPRAWLKAWKEYSQRAYSLYVQRRINYFALFDIANFYDSVKLDRLEAIIRARVKEPTKLEVVDLLMYFLRNSSRQVLSYFPRTLGLPQDEIGDCSRVLANLYLQEYDLEIADICKSYGAHYLRYSDDQIIGTEKRAEAKELIFRASKLLLRFGLNLNASKVQILSREEFGKYWAFDIMQHLGPPYYDVNRAFELFKERLESRTKFRDVMVMRKFLSQDVEELAPYAEEVLRLGLTESMITNFNQYYLGRMYLHAGGHEPKTQFLSRLADLSEDILCNEYHLRVLAFARERRLDGPDVERVRVNLARVNAF